MLLAAILALLALARDTPGRAFDALKFQSDGTFQISIFEDLHFGESMSSMALRSCRKDTS